MQSIYCKKKKKKKKKNYKNTKHKKLHLNPFGTLSRLAFFFKKIIVVSCTFFLNVPKLYNDSNSFLELYR